MNQRNRFTVGNEKKLLAIVKILIKQKKTEKIIQIVQFIGKRFGSARYTPDVPQAAQAHYQITGI